MKKAILLSMIFGSQLSFAANVEKNLVKLSCSGVILTLNSKTFLAEEKVASTTEKWVNVINPWYQGDDEIKELKAPQIVVSFDTLKATVKKGINDPKDVVLEVYQVDKSGNERRLGFAAGPVIAGSGLGLSLGIDTDKYAVQYHCQEQK